MGKLAPALDFDESRSDGALVTWIPVIVGLSVMVGLLLAAFVRAPRDDPTTAGGEAVTAYSPGTPPQIPAAGQPGPPRDPGAGTAPTGAGLRGSAGVTGRYRVLSSYGDSFIGEVLIVNSASTARGWTVQLRFPPDVGRLRTAWVESAPQATLRRSGQSYTFTGTAPVTARSSVALRFQLDRSGGNNNPDSCMVNGMTCAGT